jgi:hypothetical protein
VLDVVKKLDKEGKGEKIFAVIKGIVLIDIGLSKPKMKLKGEKRIYSLLELSEIISGSLADHFLKKSWEDLAEKAHWKHPHKSSDIVFHLQVSRP